MLVYAATGMKGGDLGRHKEDILIDAAAFFGDLLKLNRFRGIIEIRVPRKRGYIDKCVGGYCSADQFKMDGKNWWFINIELANIAKKDMFRNLAHEMIHAKQFLRKELDSSLSSWKGIKFSSTNGDDFMLDSPWEQEAYGLEMNLYNQYMERKNVSRI